MNQDAIIDSPLVERVWEVTIDWTEPLLGSQPSHDIARRFVEDGQRKRLTRELLAEGLSLGAARATAEERLRQTTVALDGAEDEDEEDLHITVFPRDDEGLHLWDYQLKGYLKGAVKLLGARVPVVLTSRADNVRMRIGSAAVAKLLAHARRTSAPRVVA